jgi:D-alanyl-D-alanine carboxypeptidase
MKKTFWLLALLLAAQFGNAQDINPKLAAMLQHTLDSMRQVLNVKSLSAAVTLPGGETWAGAKGISSLNPLDSATTSHLYAIGSITKTFTAGCVLQLADEGLLSLDDSLHEWVDTIPFINPNITIRQLLRHQSGLYDVITDGAFQPAMNAHPDSIWQYQDVVETFIHAPYFQPGGGFRYSNTNYLLLGIIIEKATGNPYYLELHNRFALPLGLGSMAMLPYEPLTADVANLWLDLNGDGITDDTQELFETWNAFNSSAAPAGAYYSNATDLSKWIRTYFRGDLLSAVMMAQMKTTVATTFPSGTKYGLGVMERNYLGLQGFGHGGDVGYSASAWYFPAKDISIAVLNNDAKNNSWTLAPVITALLQTYIDCENAVSPVHEIAPAATVRVFPNPFSHEINLAMEATASAAPVRFKLVDALGRVVWASDTIATQGGAVVCSAMRLEQLPNGLYFLQALQGDGELGKAVKVWKAG